uniref:Uncharacterized protein n=1 Tax=Nelumbo nucifera TaxID=4432 RepID=A0A822ZT14_NELNU|nr:TPA_asm: hypothetical protein HUJ06_018329 [Nelumbo nucifera]
MGTSCASPSVPIVFGCPTPTQILDYV